MTARTARELHAGGGEDLGNGRVVGAVGVDVAVTHLIAGTDHEGGAELRDALAGLVDASAALPRLDRRPRGRRGQEPGPLSAVLGSGARRLRAVGCQSG